MSNPFTPAAFVAKWKRTKLSERAASQEHFLDLCRLLGQPTPAEHDATGAEYTFEKGITIGNAPGNANLPIGRGAGGTGEQGFADVWWDGKFGWEYKRKGKYKNLAEAYAQLQRYREALNNPPLLIVSDIERIEIHTNFTNTANETYEITFDDILDGPGIDKLRRIFTRPESFKPAKTTEQVTLAVATEIGKIAQRLQKANHDPHAVAHFLMKCMFCLFAEKVPGLLPERLFKKLLDRHNREPERFTKLAHDLFQKMATGGDFGSDPIPWFNGGLFDDAPPIELSSDDLGVLSLAANQDWAHIEPSILGTLFERSLDPSKRAQIGAHYTSKEDILLVIDPVIMDPLRKEWQKLKQSIEDQLQNGTRSVSEAPPAHAQEGTQSAQAANKPPKSNPPKSKIPPTAQPLTPIHQQISQFLAQLSSLKILDPACGSGNFLYVAIQQLLTLEKEVITFAAQPPISLRLLPRIRPTQLLGIEINPYAAELAQVSIWIGFLQWLHLNGFPVATDTPILSKLQTIQNRDAILDFTENPRRDREGALPLATPAQWPDAHFIIGNPPFLGSKLFRASGLPDDYIQALYQAYDLPKTSDLCCYWFELARRKIESIGDATVRERSPETSTPPPRPPSATARANPRSKSKASDQSTQTPTTNSEISNPKSEISEILNLKSEINLSTYPEISLPRAGLLATQGIRGGDNRTVLQRIKQSGDIFMAWSDREWTLDGAAVRVSIVGFASGVNEDRRLDGTRVLAINPNLTTHADTHTATTLKENQATAFIGDAKKAKFEIDWKIAREMMATKGNPNGRTNCDVLKPWVIGEDIVRRFSGDWIVDFGSGTPMETASQYELPFEYVRKHVKPFRDKVRNDLERKRWWLHARPAPDCRAAIARGERYLATSIIAKHQLFVWLSSAFLPSHSLTVFGRTDDYFFGIVQNSVHTIWTRRMGTQLEGRPRYTPSDGFESFPFPWPPGKEKTKHPAYKRIAAAAKELNDLRERWLNPPELLKPLAQILDATDKFLDVPKEARPLIRHSALMAQAAQSPNLKKRTLTNLYNQRPTWLKLAHEKLDRAVLAAYAAIDPEGDWSEDWAALYTETGAGTPLPPEHPQAAARTTTDQKILTNLLRLNHLRATAEVSP